MCVTVPLHFNVLTSYHSTNVIQFEDSQTLYILIPYNQTKWTKTTWKTFEESIRRDRNSYQDLTRNG
jgi:hypothetical protein